MIRLKIKKLDPEAIVPTRAYSEDAGLDVYSLESGTLYPGEGALFNTGIAVEIEPGYFGMMADRSSMAKKGFKVSGGIIDAPYRGPCGVMLRNITKNQILEVKKGERIAQLIIIPIATPDVIVTDELSETDRGANGWGSTNK